MYLLVLQWCYSGVREGTFVRLELSKGKNQRAFVGGMHWQSLQHEAHAVILYIFAFVTEDHADPI